MTLSYAPDGTPAHHLDPRTKLLFQAAFAVAAFDHATPAGLAALTAVAALAAVTARVPVRETFREYRAFAPFLLAGPAMEALTLGPPWVVPADAVRPALASYRVILLLAVSAAYVRSTPVRDSRAAIQRLVPGRVGVVFGAGVGFVLRFLPLLRDDLSTVRTAVHARLGDECSLLERVRLVGVTGLRRAFHRADRLALALQARCFSFNPTLPELRFSRADAPVVATATALAASALV